MALADRRLYALIYKKLRAEDLAHLEDAFEDLSDYDCDVIEDAIVEIRVLKRKYVVQTICLPFLLLFLMVTSGLNGVVEGWKLQCQAWKFLWSPQRKLLDEVYKNRILFRRDELTV